MSVRHPFDAVVIGGGHNGLVCASYLAGAGMKVRLIEVRDQVGGAAVTESFHPGFRNSTASYTVSLLHPKVIKDLNLAEHGLKIVERAAANFLPLSDNQYLLMGRSLPEIQGEVARFSTRDAQSPKPTRVLRSTGAGRQCGARTVVKDPRQSWARGMDRGFFKRSVPSPSSP